MPPLRHLCGGPYHSSANGHPNGSSWRQLHCSACEGYFLETRSTPLHDKQVSVDTGMGCRYARGEALLFRMPPWPQPVGG